MRNAESKHASFVRYDKQALHKKFRVYVHTDNQDTRQTFRSQDFLLGASRNVAARKLDLAVQGLVTLINSYKQNMYVNIPMIVNEPRSFGAVTLPMTRLGPQIGHVVSTPRC